MDSVFKRAGIDESVGLTASNGNVNVRFRKNDNSEYDAGNAENYSYGTTYGAWKVVPDDVKAVQFYRKENNSEKWKTAWFTLNEDNNYGRGKFYKATTNNGDLSPTSAYGNSYNSNGYLKGSWGSEKATWIEAQSADTYVSEYQIEDRYGFVAGINDTNDVNNFIYVDTSANTSYKPYVKFYPNADGSGTAIEGHKSDDNNTTSPIQMESAGTNLYRIRLPKNAKSFKIADTATGTLSSAIPLEEDVTVNGNTVEGFRHAGTTFAVSSGGAVSVGSLRSGFTVNKEEMADPLNPRSDWDYVYFTDTSGTFADGGKVYAYFYGDADGEYMVSDDKSWPGILATTPNTNLADTTYSDNSNKNVYKFRIPKGNEGKYSRVIFTNGKANTSANDQLIKITQSQPLTGGTNYKLSSADQVYGKFAPSGTVYAVTTDSSKRTSGETGV